MGRLCNLLVYCACLPDLIRDYLAGRITDQANLIDDCLRDLDCSHGWEELAEPIHTVVSVRSVHWCCAWGEVTVEEYLDHTPEEGLSRKDCLPIDHASNVPRQRLTRALYNTSHVGWLMGMYLLGQDVPADVYLAWDAREIGSTPHTMRVAGKTQQDVLDWLVSQPHLLR